MDTAAYRTAERALWAHYGLEPEERFVTLPRYGTKLRVQEFGHGTSVLFVHGGPTSGANWAAQLPYLDGLRSIVIDRPGSGLSEDADWSRSMLADFMSYFIADVLDALDIAHAPVVASSWGGTLALRAAVATPERVDRIVLQGGPSAIEGQPLPAVERLMLLPGACALIGRMTPGRGMQRSALKANGHAAAIADGRIPDAYWEWYDRLMRDTPTYANEFGALRLLGNWSMAYGPDIEVRREDLARIEAPVLIVWGGNEPYGGREEAERLAAAMADARVDFMPDAGHLPWLDDPAHVGRATAGFLAEAQPYARAA